MTEAPFTNRELQGMFEEIKEKLNSHTTVHIEILNQVKSTNGKVAEIQKWRERINGALQAAGVLCILIILPFIIWFISWSFNRINSIDEIVAKSLNDYQFQIIEP